MNQKKRTLEPITLSEHRPALTVVPPKQKPDGRDELNFAEFPIAAISDRPDPNTKTLYFENSIFDKESGQMVPRKLTITAADAFGLPSQKDEEVILALLQLTAEQKCESRQVSFTRFELVKRLAWPVSGQSYRRLQEALNRWTGVTLFYENAWRDRVTKSWATETFHMLERVKLVDTNTSEDAEKGSFIVWGEPVFKSFRAGHLKAFDYDFYLRLRSNVSKRLYRFLDKRFYHAENRSFDLRTLALEHIGLSRNAPTGDIKRKINEAYDELEKNGFLEPVPPEKRFTKVRAKEWKVHFTHAKTAVLEAESTNEDNSLLSRLMRFGVGAQKALELIKNCDPEVIENKLEIAFWLRDKNDARISKNPAGYLVKSIEDEFSIPSDFQKIKLKELEAARLLEEKRVGEAKEKKRSQKEREKEERQEKLVTEFWAGVSDERREEILALELQKVSALKREMIERGGPGAEALKNSILRDYALEAIAEG